MQKHASFVANMAQKKFNKQVVETMIENLGDEYFSGRYRDG